MEPTTPLDEETAKKVIRQVEFYFSDSNLPRDAFMKKTISESEDGMVSLALIISFSRMRGHLGLGEVKPEDVANDNIMAVAETLKTSTFLKVSEDGKKVGRITKLAEAEEVMKQADVRTIAASPLEYDVKLENVESFFGQYAKVNSVRLPRHVADNRLFCGTALIEFSNDEDATNILKQTLIYSGAELELKPKRDFDEMRAKQGKEVARTRPQKVSNNKDNANANADAEPDYPEGLIVAFRLKSITAGNYEEQNGKHKSTSDNVDGPDKDAEHALPLNTSVDTEINNLVDTKVMKNDEENAEDEEEVDETGEETVVDKSEKSSDVTDDKGKQESREERKNIEAYKDDQDVVLREDLKLIFNKFGTVKFVDFKFKSDSGYIRFEDAEAVQKARAAAAISEKGGLIVKNFIATLDLLTGDAEKEYWSLLREKQGRHHDNHQSSHRRGGKHKRGGRNFGGKHSRLRENDSTNRPNKVQKI